MSLTVYLTLELNLQYSDPESMGGLVTLGADIQDAYGLLDGWTDP